MVPGRDKWIRSLKENSTGKVVSDEHVNRWEWQSDDETARQLKKLSNEELSIEKTDLHPLAARVRSGSSPSKAAKPAGHALRPSRDAGGGFNPYDHTGKPRKR